MPFRKFAYLTFSWQTGLFLILLFSSVRFFLVLSANVTGSYQTVSLIFLVMILFPFLFLDKEGRKDIGLVRIKSWLGVFKGALLGAACCALIYFFFKWFLPESNPFVYISGSYKNLPSQLGEQRMTFFLVYSSMSMLFSPFGEEFFYRGVIHECFRNGLGQRAASMVDSGAFALVHLAHFGIVYAAAGWDFLLLPSLLWVLLLFLTCLGFNYARRAGGSVYGAVMSHATFNLSMNYFIFYHVLE